MAFRRQRECEEEHRLISTARQRPSRRRLYANAAAAGVTGECLLRNRLGEAVLCNQVILRKEALNNCAAVKTEKDKSKHQNIYLPELDKTR